MRLQELGHQIRQARLARRLTQARLAAEAGLSRTTLNQLENGLFPDLGVKKVQAILDHLGLTLSLQEAGGERAQDFLQMATTTANVSFKSVLTEDELVRMLLTGKVPPSRRPHFRVLLEEASPAMMKGLIRETARWTKSGRVEKNLAKIARELGSTRKIEDWLKTA